MARTTKNLTISPDSAEYLKKFPNQSKVVDEAIELHRNKDKIIMKEPELPRAEVIKIIK